MTLLTPDMPSHTTLTPPYPISGANVSPFIAELGISTAASLVGAFVVLILGGYCFRVLLSPPGDDYSFLPKHTSSTDYLNTSSQYILSTHLLHTFSLLITNPTTNHSNTPSSQPPYHPPTLSLTLSLFLIQPCHYS